MEIKEVEINSKKRLDYIDLSEEIEDFLKTSEKKDGLCNVFVRHSTAGITINENFDPNIGKDIQIFLKDKIKDGIWKHDAIDGNGAAHIKASIIGSNTTIPFINRKLMLGTWQTVMLYDFEGPRKRKVTISLL